MSEFVESGEVTKFISPCSTCVHKSTSHRGCKAFNDKIPIDILTGKNKHKVKFPGQSNSIVFEKEKQGGSK